MPNRPNICLDQYVCRASSPREDEYEIFEGTSIYGCWGRDVRPIGDDHAPGHWEFTEGREVHLKNP